MLSSTEPRYFAVGTGQADNFAQDQFGSASVNEELFPIKDFDQHIYAESGDDRIGGSGGDDLIDGGAGNDIAFYRGAAAEYAISAQDGVTTIEHFSPGLGPSDGTDTLQNVEVLQFADGSRTAAGVPLAGPADLERTPITLGNLIDEPSLTLIAIRDELSDRFDQIF